MEHIDNQGGLAPRLSRLLHLLQMLHSGIQRNADEFAQVLGVSRRTVFRDLETLESAGVPVVFDAYGKTYRILNPQRVHFQVAEFEALSLAVMLEAMKLTPATTRASTSLQSELAMRTGSAGTLHAALEFVKRHGDSPADAAVDEHCERLFQGFFSRQRVRISYLTDCDQIQSTLLSPYQLRLQVARSLEIFGYSTFHRGVVQIDTARIRSSELTEEPYELPVFQQA